jgi:small subunit ribosomal protein S4
MFHYGLREEQLKRFVRKAKSSPATDWMDTLIGDLECRLDNLVFRLGFAPSIPAARQMVRHNHILVNGKRVNISSAIIRVGSKISLTSRAYQSPNYLQARQQPRLMLPDFLVKDTSGQQEVGILKLKPHSGDIPFPFEKSLVTEFYSKI